MGPQDELTLGEVARSVKRIESAVDGLSRQMQTALGPVSVHTAQIDAIESDMKEMRGEVRDVTATANKVAGVGAVLAVLAGLIPWPWRH